MGALGVLLGPLGSLFGCCREGFWGDLGQEQGGEVQTANPYDILRFRCCFLELARACWVVLGALGSLLGGFGWPSATLGVVLGRLSELLGRSWRHLGLSWVDFGASWGDFGLPVGRLGAVLG